jgi:hypothetical protein
MQIYGSIYMRYTRFRHFLFLIMLSQSVFLQDLHASEGNIISYLEGEVVILQSGVELDGDFGTELFDGDMIITGPDALVIIDLGNTGVLKMKENSTLVLNNTGGSTDLELRRGGLFSRVNKLTGKGYSVQSETVVAGVRGTEFFMAYGKSFTEGDDIWLCVNEGIVEVAIEGTEESVLVNEGEGISILSGKKLTDPRYYPWTEELNWNSDPASGSVEDDVSLDGLYTDLLDQDYF